MAIHHLTPPVRGGERPRLPSTQASGVLRPRRETLHNVQTFRSGGPVTQAIRTMRAAEPVRTETISVLSEADAAIAAIREGVMRFLAERIERDIALLDALDGDCDLEDGHDREIENEHGGDVQDEPHDPEEDGDWHEQHAYVLGFDGTSYLRGRA